MSHRPLDPRICNIGHDANALDLHGTDRDRLVERFCQLSAARVLSIVVAGGVRKEVQHPRTPVNVKVSVLPQIFNLQPGLNTSQRSERTVVLEIIQGNARPGKHTADASHLSEAAETGCGCFITEDRRILDRRRALRSVLPTSLTIVTLPEFFVILDGYLMGEIRADRIVQPI
jgi:hypothetical protein